MSLQTPEPIKTLQRTLYRKAKAEPTFRFYLLYDKIHRADILRHAYALARSNGGAPGVDGITFARIEAEGLDGWLAGLREDVPARTGAAGDDPQARRRRTPARHPDHSGPGGPDRRQAGAGPHLRGGLRGLWLSARLCCIVHRNRERRPESMTKASVWINDRGPYAHGRVTTSRKRQRRRSASR